MSAVGLFLTLPNIRIHQSRAYAAVVINEVLPKTQDIANSWIELYNTGTDPVSLDRWKIENTFGDTKSFTLNASAVIPGKEFLLLSQSQFGFTLNKEGDTVRLFDANNNQVDNQGYPGILGYNISIGRSTDGAGSWSICTVATKNKANQCPPPTPTSTPLPTPLPTDTPIPTPTATPTLANTPTLIPSLPPTQAPAVLGTENNSLTASSSNNTILFSLPKLETLAVVCIGLVWAFITIFILWRKSRTHRS